MRTTLLILFLTFSLLSHAQDKDSIIFSILKKEVQWFIDTAKKISIDNGRNNVYNVYLHKTFPDTNSLCFEISYFEDPTDYIYNTPPYSFELNGEIILISNHSGVVTNWKNKNYVEQIDSSGKLKIKNKLVDGNTIIMRENEHARLLYWNDGRRIRRKFCDNLFNESNGPFNGKIKCDWSDFAMVKQSFYDDSVNRESRKIKHHYLNK